MGIVYKLSDFICNLVEMVFLLIVFGNCKNDNGFRS